MFLYSNIRLLQPLF